jgi:hypothetical protein
VPYAMLENGNYEVYFDRELLTYKFIPSKKLVIFVDERTTDA